MSAREKFEDFASKLSMPLQRDSDGYGLLDGYGWRETDCAWLCWKASRTAALEEAAQRVEPRNSPDDWTEYAKIRAQAAADIRALDKPEGE